MDRWLHNPTGCLLFSRSVSDALRELQIVSVPGSPRRCPICCKILDPLRTFRKEGRGYINEFELAFPEMAWDVVYLTRLCFHPDLIISTKAEQTLKVKRETVLDHVVF